MARIQFFRGLPDYDPLAVLADAGKGTAVRFDNYIKSIYIPADFATVTFRWDGSWEGTATKIKTIELTVGMTPQKIFTISEIDYQAGSFGSNLFNQESWTVIGSQQGDVFSAGDYNDVYDLRAGDDIAWGLGGNDVMDGGKGNDILDGSAGRDRLKGFKGDDTLHGGEGNDALDGEQGRDVLVGGQGNDRLTGGIAADDFVFSQLAWGDDVVTDWEDGVDQIILSGTGLTFEDLVIKDFGDDTVIKVRAEGGGSDGTIGLIGVSDSSLIQASDFQF